MPPVLRSKSFQKALNDMSEDDPTALGKHGKALASEDEASVQRCLKAMHATAPPSAAPYPAPRRVKRTASGGKDALPVHQHDDTVPVKVKSVAASMDRCAQALEHEQEAEAPKTGSWRFPHF